MKVRIIAYTTLAINPETDDYTIKEIGYVPHKLDPDADELAEAAGRQCYLSWGRPNPDTATNEGYLANILDHGHFSVLEHSSISYQLSGVSRSLTHELVRHRHLSFSQVSQRYVDHADADFVVPPVVERHQHNATGASAYDVAAYHLGKAQDMYPDIVKELRFNNENSKKEAHGAARAILPESTETTIIVTGNIRALREFFVKRISPHADEEIRIVAREMLRQAFGVVPNSLQDLKGLLA